MYLFRSYLVLTIKNEVFKKKIFVVYADIGKSVFHFDQIG